MDYLERYRNLKMRITEKNYKEIVTWFNDVDPGSFIDICILGDDYDEKEYYLWNQKGNVLKLKVGELFVFDDEDFAKDITIDMLFYCINQEYDKDSTYRESIYMNDNKKAWNHFAKSDFYKKCVSDTSSYHNYIHFNGSNNREKILLNNYNNYIERLLNDDNCKELPSKLFVMGDIGIYKVEKESIVISFDIRINVYEQDELFINNLRDFDAQNEVKPYKYRKNVLDYLFSAINNMGNIGNEYANLEIPLMPRINKLIRLLYMYFSGKGIFKFKLVDDLTMLNIYKRENLPVDDIIGPDDIRRLIDMQDGDNIIPEDIIYTIDEPLSHAELMTLLGKYSEPYSLDYDNDFREISICVINIERAARFIEEFFDDYVTVRALLIKIVFYHEMGHMIFRKISPKQSKTEREKTEGETIANWVACLSYEPSNVEYIRNITYTLCLFQTDYYQGFVKFPRFDMSNLSKYKEYCTELEKLLEKIYG